MKGDRTSYHYGSLIVDVGRRQHWTSGCLVCATRCRSRGGRSTEEASNGIDEEHADRKCLQHGPATWSRRLLLSLLVSLSWLNLHKHLQLT